MIFVTGATGNVGREVVNLLLDGGAKVVAVTRHHDAGDQRHRTARPHRETAKDHREPDR